MIYVGWLTARELCATLYCVNVRYKWRDVLIWKQFSMKVRWRIYVAYYETLHISRVIQHTSKQAKYYDAYSMVDFANKSILSMAHLNICFYHTSVIFSMILACSSHSFGIALCNTQPTRIYFKTVCSGAITLFVSGNTMYACIYIYFFSSSLCVCVFFYFCQFAVFERYLPLLVC